MEKFDRILSPVIDNVLGQRSKTFGYQYSEIIRSLMCVYFVGLMYRRSVLPPAAVSVVASNAGTCSSDLVLRIMDELKVDNISYTSESGKTYDFNTADKVNDLLLEALLATGQLKAGEEYDFDFDHEFLKTEKYDAKHTYKKFLDTVPAWVSSVTWL